MDDERTLFTVSVKEFDHSEYQVRMSVGVQHFDIGPRWETYDEAEWLMDQFMVAMSNAFGAEASFKFDAESQPH